jgi:hypothetical protein
VTLDFVMELPRTASDHDAVLVIVDRMSKVVRLCPTTTALDAVVENTMISQITNCGSNAMDSTFQT